MIPLAGIVLALVFFPDISEHAAVVLGVFSAILAGNVIWVALKSEKMEKVEDANTIIDVKFIASQCENALDMLIRATRTHDEGAYRALDQLAARITLCITRYRRYLNPMTIESLKGVEEIIMDAQINRNIRFGRTIIPVKSAVNEIKSGIREINDPELQAARRKI